MTTTRRELAISHLEELSGTLHYYHRVAMKEAIALGIEALKHETELVEALEEAYKVLMRQGRDSWTIRQIREVLSKGKGRGRGD